MSTNEFQLYLAHDKVKSYNSRVNHAIYRSIELELSSEHFRHLLPHLSNKMKSAENILRKIVKTYEWYFLSIKTSNNWFRLVSSESWMSMTKHIQDSQKKKFEKNYWTKTQLYSLPNLPIQRVLFWINAFLFKKSLKMN